MKRILLLSVILLTFACSGDSLESIKYDVYKSVIDSNFGHLAEKYPSYIVVNDTLSDFKSDLGILIYSVQKNDKFFEECCEGDSSFKDFILGIKGINIKKELLKAEKIRPSSNFKVLPRSAVSQEEDHFSIYFSKIVFNKNYDKAILYVNKSSSGSLYFVEQINNKWYVKNKILMWII
ncbi:hypothetical protein [Telluribacter sp. SYSU D00476]|uniref:hypothetical protein n=1 Tax=Telluribacter sp. SYSU D00476 TaxID=2811430 RepID=UPI001FF19ECD|nr:hypothetical protein [Telluribacter sp. SYSU D00476]